MGRGYLISFEGVEGAGKTTQLRRAAAFLEAAGYRVVTSREPGGTFVGEAARAVLLDRRAGVITPLAELFLYLAARSQLVAEVVRPALETGAVVLLDRYVHSTLAYQGYGLAVDAGGETAAGNVAKLRELCLVAAGGLWPDLAIFFDLPAEAGLARLAGAAPDRIEARDLNFHRRVRGGFLALAQAEPDTVRIVDASGTPDEVAREVEAAIRERLAL